MKNYQKWELDRRIKKNSLFWQYDTNDGMEHTVSGRILNNGIDTFSVPATRPTINSYMYGDAMAIAKFAQILNKPLISSSFTEKAENIKQGVQERLWNKELNFFTVLPKDYDEGHRSLNIRELIGYVPWYFNLPDDKMEYAADEETEEEMAPEAESEALESEDEGDDMGLEDEGGEEEAPADDEEAPAEEEGMGDEEGEGEEPAGEEGEEDISGEMEDNDKKIASLAAEYDEDELFQALALKKQAGSMMEKDMSSYGEMPEGLKKHMEEKEGKGEDEEEEKKEEADHSEEVVDNAEEKKEEVSDNAEEAPEAKEEAKTDMAEEEKEEEDEEKEKSDMAEEVKEEKKETADHAEEAAPVATESLDHGEAAIGDQSIDTLNARVAELEEELNKQRKLAREKEISSFAEGLYESGKLTEQVVPKGDLVRFMETLNHKNSVNFSETGKASQFDFMRGVLESLPSMVSFEEFATPASAPKKSKSVEPNASGYAYDPNTADVHADALSYAEENGCDYLTAVKFVINNN